MPVGPPDEYPGEHGPTAWICPPRLQSRTPVRMRAPTRWNPAPARDWKVDDGFDRRKIVAIRVGNHADDLPDLLVRQNGSSQRALSRPPALGRCFVNHYHVPPGIVGNEIAPGQ